MKLNPRIAVSAVALAMAVLAPAAAAAADTTPTTPVAGKAGATELRKAPRGDRTGGPFKPPKAMVDQIRSRKGPVPKGKVPNLAPDGDFTAATTEPFWSWGVTEQQWGLNCSLETPYYEPQVTSSIGYGGTDGVPKVGQRFTIVLLYSHPGYACSGGFLADVYSELRMSSGAQLALDAQHGIQCWTNSRDHQDQWTEVTNNTWRSPDGSTGKWCETSGNIGMHGGINLGLRKLVTGTMFQIAIPVIATKEMRGAANVPTVAKFQGTTQSVIAIPTHQIAYPEVWANVLGFLPSSVGYPNPSATQVTPTSAKLTGYVYNHFKPGTARIEIGPTTAYGTNSDSVTISPDFDANMMWADWSGLQPGRTYHWRVKFTGNDGAVAYGPDQTFTTPVASVVGKVGSTLSMTAYGNRANNVRVTSADGFVRFEDLAYSMVPAAGCEAVTARAVRCPAAGIASVTVDGGAYGDRISAAGLGLKATLKGNTGPDVLTGGTVGDVLDGGTGADTLTGGGGADTASYAFRTATQPVNVSLDGVENDGGGLDVAGADRDNVGVDVENVTGGAGADTLTGNGLANVLTGGKGADRLRGLAGFDRLLAADDVADLELDCGTGTVDRALVDGAPADPAPIGCETVTLG